MVEAPLIPSRMDSLTPTQRAQIKTWAEQRDALLSEIGVHTTARDDRKKEADAEAQRLTALQTQAAEVEGRISVLDRLEEAKKNSVGLELVELEARKSRLQGENTVQESETNASKREHGIVIAATRALKDAHGIAQDKAATIEAVLGQVIDTAAAHAQIVKESTAELHAVHATVIDRANDNLAKTNIVIEKLPKMLFDMQRPIPVRRTYPPGHPRLAMDAETEKSS